MTDNQTPDTPENATTGANDEETVDPQAFAENLLNALRNDPDTIEVGEVVEGDATETDQADELPVEVCRTGGVLHTHDLGENDHVVCIATCDCGRPSLLPVLFQDGAIVTLTLTAPEDGAPGSEPSAHPPILVHINPGDEYHHEPCLNFECCGVCLSEVWESIFTNGGARIGVHAFPDEPDNILIAPFRIDNWKQTRAALTTARSRLVDA